MNILPKKSWHVRNKDNVERVRRDEENARLEEEKKAKRAALAEQEARTASLRAKSRSGAGNQKEDGSTALVKASSEKPRHLNFFQDIEDGLKQGSNAEYEAEREAEQEKQEKAIGLLTYLGQSASEKHSERPWYLKSGSKSTSQPKSDEDHDLRDAKRKDAMDPLKSMTKYLEARKEKGKEGKERQEKHHHKHSKKDKSSTEKSKKSLEQLRAERLKRERAERARGLELLSSSRGESKKAEPAIEDNPYRYNSQFNPDLVRKPRNHPRYSPY
ncbi:predicted protein [Nematostella vectensis]|uniref:CBF1-interacting co-repressor CIR N-terminal domain-containing protein n=1 Tax=Nematostella vectensis TaxID=45351 RepID=A7RRI5_NEMVE|nr:leukocyte receptor cluster member 1 homolog [Nematostella vectensis]EDO46013.1 predicted protein [Nematostella vectensis]|eukprot:XP_001638076.1 predicted protein [Nematostella vectensis]